MVAQFRCIGFGLLACLTSLGCSNIPGRGWGNTNCCSPPSCFCLAPKLESCGTGCCSGIERKTCWSPAACCGASSCCEQTRRCCDSAAPSGISCLKKLFVSVNRPSCGCTDSAPAGGVTAAPAAMPPQPAAETPPIAMGSVPYRNDDYSVLIGELHFNHRSEKWRLRYAGAGDIDRYGGSVTLDDVGHRLDGYKSGQIVRVAGQIVDPNSHELSPAYRVVDVDTVLR